MNINRHNYEEFFLLYVDNELSAADRKAVDMFVKENTDLQIELNLLQQTVLKPADIVLDKKDWLYMEAEPTALQEDLLLYADDELSAIDRKIVEGLLMNDEAAQAEWNILQQTKLQPDAAVVFDDKASLYRREAARVVPIKWWRVAAAAVLLGFGIWGGVSVYTNGSKTTAGSAELANENNTNPTATETLTGTTANSTTVIAQNENNLDVQNNSALTDADYNQATNPSNAKLQYPAQDKNGSNNVAAQNNVAVQNPQSQDNNLPKSPLQNINSSNSNQTIAAAVLPSNNNIGRVSGNNPNVVETNTNNFNRADQPVAVVQVSNTETESNGSYLNIEDKQKRTTLGGLIRKAKRVVERTTNINTGEGVKIAGFEIALK